ncbi:MAG: energy-coupling factor transporter ATPase [Clostridia bacterium]|nr:energy-coupling factor transporter ATPase [Clostridia bacterium]MBQ8304200.1 energy-coupling factor transporter ATPase [Clostridia bacterium]
MSILEVMDLSYSYSGGLPSPTAAISNINLKIEQGEIIGIIGHTGSGKSTLVQHLNGLLTPTSGKVLFEGKDIWEKGTKIKKIREKVGLVFQYPEYQLFEETAKEDIAFGPKNMGITGDELAERVISAARSVELNEELLNKSPFDLSGGEKRRVAIAGVLAMNPKVLIFDEPTAGLDPIGRENILKIVKDCRDRNGATVIMVSHSMDDIALVADRILVMNRGSVFMFDTAHNVFSNSQKLIEIGLNVPNITKVFVELKKQGINIPSNVYTMDDAVRAILSYENRRDENA